MKASELIRSPEQAVYHLALKPGELAPHIISVGDPQRLPLFIPFFSDIRVNRQHREFCTLTGRYKDLELSVISTGIGTDNIDIAWNEVDALFNIDFGQDQTVNTPSQLKWLRLGTCGALTSEIPLGSLINSRYAIGLDGLMEYYYMPYDPQRENAWEYFIQRIQPRPGYTYLAQGSDAFSRLLPSAILQGITLTAKGFYGPQGRDLGRLHLRMPNLVDELLPFQYDGCSVLNMEMESAGILGMAEALGHQAASLSVVLANRAEGTFVQDPLAATQKLIEAGLEYLYQWAKK